MLPVRDHLPTRSFPGVNYALIALNLGFFGLEVWAVSGGADAEVLSRQWALVPALLVAHPFASAPRLLSHMFL
ncbi:MAG TPA: hypothetical protein VMT45_06385, partial [Thermoanaerobaculaceae bacterium]|nr:hypothetical protein [Thermoanaerobaculaceae bacterium]